MANFWNKQKKEVETYIKPLLDKDETIETFTITNSVSIVGIILYLATNGAVGDYPASIFICMTSKRLVICHAYTFLGAGKLSISPASDSSEIINVPFSEITRIQFKKGVFVGKLIVEIEQKGEFQYSFPS